MRHTLCYRPRLTRAFGFLDDFILSLNFESFNFLLIEFQHFLIDFYFISDRRRFQDYISPGDEIEGLTSSIHRNRSHSYSADSPTEPERDPLPENVLCNNLGLDIVVAVAKTDYMSTLEKEYDYKEEHFDFIQQAIRKFCLNCKYRNSKRFLNICARDELNTQTCHERPCELSCISERFENVMFL